MIRQKPISLKIDSGLIDRLDYVVAQRPGFNRNKAINQAVALYLDMVAFSEDYYKETQEGIRVRILRHLASHVIHHVK